MVNNNADNKFEVGQVVICRNNSGFEDHLTIGKEYSIVLLVDPPTDDKNNKRYDKTYDDQKYFSDRKYYVIQHDNQKLYAHHPDHFENNFEAKE